MSAGFSSIIEPHVALALENPIEPGPATSPPLASKPAAPPQIPDAAAKTPTLLVGPVDTKRAGDPVALSVSARDLAGGFVVISGFAPGTSLSVGTLLGDSSWLVPTAELDRLEIRPPSRFVGTMDINVELRRADTKLADRKSLHIEWVPAVSLDADQMAALLARANELIASGDIAAAQLVLRRAAEAGSAQAAMTLAGTYDPVLLAKLGVHGFAADIVAARQWYEKAKQLGSIAAERRLELLAVKRD
jgi:hypothetical protein